MVRFGDHQKLLVFDGDDSGQGVHPQQSPQNPLGF